MLCALNAMALPCMYVVLPHVMLLCDVPGVLMPQPLLLLLLLLLASLPTARHARARAEEDG